MALGTAKRLLAFALLACLPLAAGAGCDYQDIDELVFVVGAGIDFQEEAGEYTVTVEVVRHLEGQGQAYEPVVLSGSGESIVEALGDIGVQTSGELYFLHCRLIVVGESAAKAGIDTVVDAIMRSARAERIAKTAVAKGGTAADIFSAEAKIKPTLSAELAEAIETRSKKFGLTSSLEIFELYNEIPTGLSSLLPALIIEEDEGEKSANLDGTAVLKEGVLQGYLTPEESTYCLFTMAKSFRGFINIRSTALDKNFSFHVVSSKCTVDPVLEEGRLVMKISAEAKGFIPEISGIHIDESIDEESFQRDLREQLAAHIEEVVSMVKKEYGADAFSFKLKAENKYRGHWSEWERDWEAIYRDAPVRVEVAAFISSNGLGR